MPVFRFNKLVRDTLPQVYDELGQVITSRRLIGKELLRQLRAKLVEEAEEIPVDSDNRQEIIDELGDVRQVVNDIQHLLEIDDEEIEAARQAKFAKKGGFTHGIFVEKIELRDDDTWVDYYRQEPERYEEIVQDEVVKDKKDTIDVPELLKGMYRHNKKGHLYEVLGVALETETGEVLVVYRPLYENKYEIFARPYAMFTELVELDGVMKPRFEKVDS